MKIKKLRKKAARQRMAFFAIVTVLICVAVVFLGGKSSYGSENIYVSEHVVSYGDTLWSIAKEYKPDSVTMDEYLYKLRRANSMTSSAINVGDVLIIPE
jgi:nucleoid-associated protein YgaU